MDHRAQIIDIVNDQLGSIYVLFTTLVSRVIELHMFCFLDLIDVIPIMFGTLTAMSQAKSFA